MTALLDHSGRMAEYLEAVEAGHADPDPWEGFASYVEAVGVMQARDHGIADLVTMGVAGAPEIEALRARAFDGLSRLVDRARAAGVLRADFTTEDVVVLMMANAGLLERSSDISEAASRRLVHLLLDGFRASAATEGPADSQRPRHPPCDATQRRTSPRTIPPPVPQQQQMPTTS